LTQIGQVLCLSINVYLTWGHRNYLQVHY
jgi:hypothetical protein